MKITNAEAMTFFRKFNQGEFPHQRLGQAFINYFDLGDACLEKTGPCLFYLCDAGRAAKVIWEEWVEG